MSDATARFASSSRPGSPGAELDPALCWHMVRSRDPRFDGLFYFAVKTTGIYCRPICPARTPLAANCVFFEHAAQAEQGGFRPCLRCRPELAPDRWSNDPPATEADRLVRSALKILDHALLDKAAACESGLQELARQLGVSDRHLRRVFVQAMGVSPQAYLRTRRLLMAKRLLTETRLPVIEVAAISGFGSLRRFNDSWRQQYGLTPSQLRRNNVEASQPTRHLREAVVCLTFSLPTRPPFDLDALLAFFQRRQIAGLESISAQHLRRGLVISGTDGLTHSGWIEVLAMAGTQGTGLRVRVSPSLAPVIPAVLDRVRRAFDLSCRPEPVSQTLGSLASGHEGLRIPGSLDGFEIAVRAIVGQQITVEQATRRVTDLVSAYGPPIDSPWLEVNRAFPSAACLAEQPLEPLSQVLQHRARARALHALSREVASGRLSLEPTADIETAMAGLRAIPGVGEWTAQYIALRALGWPDAFPDSDAGLLKALGTRDPRQARQMAQIWRPFRGYAALHLWRRGPAADDSDPRIRLDRPARLQPTFAPPAIIPIDHDPDPAD